MSELFNKEVNAQKGKNFWGSHKLPEAHKKVCDENEKKKEEKESDAHVEMLLMEGSPI